MNQKKLRTRLKPGAVRQMRTHEHADVRDCIRYLRAELERHRNLAHQDPEQ